MVEFINDGVFKPTLSLPEGEATHAPNYHVRMGFSSSWLAGHMGGSSST
jgi:hypothetical protein